MHCNMLALVRIVEMTGASIICGVVGLAPSPPSVVIWRLGL